MMRSLPAAVCLFTLLLGCAGRELSGLAGIDVAILALDACRADKLGAYGYSRPTSPVLDALAAEPDSVVFRRHYVHGASTKPSTASLFTGLHTHQHGIHRELVETDRSRTERVYRVQSLDPGFRTLAEIFRDSGFETIGVVKSQHLVEDYGFDQGFEHYVTRRQLRKDRARVEEALSLIAGTRRRFFAYIHLNACHHPFRVAERDADFMREWGFDYPEAERREAGIDFTTPDIKFLARKGQLRLEPDDVRFLNLVYDAQLRRVDRTLVAPFLQGLRDLERYDDTLLIVTADHGEELYEHGGYAHGHAVWEEISHVPLIVKFPAGLAPRFSDAELQSVTSNLDILPSLSKLLGQPPSPELPGLPIFSGATAQRKLLVSATQWGVVTRGSKLVQAPSGGPMLFDLERDPGEQRDRADEDAERTKSLQSWGLERLGEERRFAPLVEEILDPDDEAALRALGYVE